jgi:O-antigen/teichoic acid export membrane protein
MIGNVWVPAVWLLQMVLIAIYVPNYSNELGYFNLAYQLVSLIYFLSLFTNSLLGGFSEAYEHNRHNLVKLYIYQGFKWCNYLAFFIVAALFAAGDLFILGAAGPTWARANIYLPILLVFMLFGPYSWIGDATFEGTGKTMWAGTAWIMEQIIRAVLLLTLLMIFKDMIFVVIAYIPALIIKNVFMWIIVKKKISDYKLFPWTSFIAPGIAALITFIFLRFASLFVWEIPLGDKIINVLLIFVVGIFGFIYFFAFLVGFFGGFDENTLKEFKRASAMIGGIGVFTKILYKVTYIGCKISPLHNRFKITIFETAMNEAYTLTLEKESLKI